MSKTLIIAEKPSVAAAIAEALGGYTKMNGWHESPTGIISNGIGHLIKIDAPASENNSDRSLASLPVIPTTFELTVIDKTKDQFQILRKLLARPDVDCVVNACDAGREGELIFRLIYEKAGCKKPMKRMWFQTMTKEGIQEAFRNLRPGHEFDNLCDEAKCRSEADWIIGINSSRAITRLNELQKQRYENMGAGRVQSPTLTMPVERELEIKYFVPQDYWEIHGTFGAAAGNYVGKWVAAGTPPPTDSDNPENAAAGSKFHDKSQAEAILNKCVGVAPSAVNDTSKKTTKVAPKLFDITTLQRTANKKYKFSAKKTLDIAQALYEKYKATTYPRTDASALPEDYVDTVRQIMGVLDARYGAHAQRVLDNDWIRGDDKRIFNNEEIADHFAIIPTLNDSYPQGMSDDEAKIYDMIVRRFLAIFHPAAEYMNTQRTTIVAGETFKSSGRVLTRRGWLEVYGQDDDDKDKTPSLCVVEPGEKVANRGIELKTLQTKPPARYTEDTLLGAMEGAGKLIDDGELRDAMKERGLGTGATRAGIIEGLLATKDGQNRPKEPYLRREGKEQYLIPTEKGMELIAFLKANGIEALTSPKMTGEWEHKLRLISKGEFQRKTFMSDIGRMATHIVDVIRARAGEVPAPQERLLGVPCPKCAGNVRIAQRTFECQQNCGFKLWREVCHRDLSDSEAEQLIRNGSIEKLDGFVSNAKKKFSAGIKLTPEFKTELVFEEREVVKGSAIEAKCPKCNGDVFFKDGQYPMYVCEKNDFKLFKTIAGRPLSDGEVVRLLNNNSLPLLDGFVSSKTQKKFKAGLKFSKDFSKVEFQFE